METRCSSLKSTSQRMQKYKREEINNQNEFIYNMLNTAEPTYTLREWDEHTGQQVKLRSIINMNEKRRHQISLAQKMIRLKQSSMLTSLALKQSTNLLNSERRT